MQYPAKTSMLRPDAPTLYAEFKKKVDSLNLAGDGFPANDRRNSSIDVSIQVGICLVGAEVGDNSTLEVLDYTEGALDEVDQLRAGRNDFTAIVYGASCEQTCDGIWVAIGDESYIRVMSSEIVRKLNGDGREASSYHYWRGRN
jgi:hypothetical protein